VKRIPGRPGRRGVESGWMHLQKGEKRKQGYSSVLLGRAEGLKNLKLPRRFEP